MKKWMFFVLFCCSFTFSFAQDIKTTCDYLDKRIREVKDGSELWRNDNQGTQKYTIWTPTGFDNNSIHISYLLKGNTTRVFRYTANALQIKSIGEASWVSTSSPVGLIEIVLENATATSEVKMLNDDGTAENLPVKYVDKIYFPYLKNDPTAFERIKKALFRLKELSTEEKDPFAN